MSGVNASSLARSTKVIAVADVVESVRLMEQDEQAFIRRWQGFLGFVTQRLPEHAGLLRKSLGDGLMLEFSDPEGCIRTALAMRDWFGQDNSRLRPEDHVHLRIGAHIAEFVADAYDIYGNGVNLAARIASLAGPGEIIISAELRDRLDGTLHAELEDLGSCHLKHLRRPVHAFRLRGIASAPVLPASALAMHGMRPTIAVLPFAMRGGCDDDVSGETVADDIVAGLARADHVQIVSRATIAGIGELRTALREEVPVHYLLTGAARGRGRQLALYAELSDVATGHVAWARSFHGELGELGTVEGPLLRDVVSALHGSVLAREVARARAQPLHGLESHTLMVSAIACMHSLAPPEFERARALLEHLVDRCPRHSVPHAWFAHLEALCFQQGDAPESARKAREHAATALRHDAACAVSLAMDGYAALHATGDLRRAAERYAQALAMQPEDSLTQLLQAELLALQGHGEQARAFAARALEVPPLGPMQPFYDRIAALAAFADGEMTEAQNLAQRAVLANPRSVPGQYMLLAAQAASGELAAACVTTERLAQEAPQLTVADFAARVPACALRERLVQALARGGLAAG